MDRDALLTAALGVAVLSGCTATRRTAPPAPSPTPSPLAHPDVAVLVEWGEAERALAFRYAPLVKAVAALAPLRANHLARAEAVDEHLARLGGGTPSPGAVVNPSAPPATLAKALAKLERDHAARCLSVLARVRDADVAVLGAELAAGARQHAVLLGLVPLT